jgi:putative SOS response-associated peptidase YedK
MRVRPRPESRRYGGFEAQGFRQELTAVCGRFRDTRSWAGLHRALVAVSLPVAEQPALNLAPRVQVRPTNDLTIVRLEEGAAFIRRARCWLIPWFHKVVSAN